MLKLKKAAIGASIVTIAAALTACGSSGTSKGPGPSPSPSTSTSTSPSSAPASASPKAAEKVTLRFFTNNSDRAAGQGKVEQALIDQYTKDHPNIEIKVETLSPDPQYQDKIKIYNASGELPDIISSWGNTSFLTPLIKNNALAEINKDSLKDMGFIPAALDGFTSGGKLYGFPRNSDFWVLYYNKKIFADNGLKTPQTEADLLKVIDQLKAKKIVPIAMDGQDAWTSGIWLDTLIQRASGTWDISKKAMDRTGSYNDPAAISAAASIQKWIKAGAFGDGFLNTDYGAARNMFGQGKAAMYMMGEWEMGMASDANFPDEVKNNLGAIPLPTIEGGKGGTGDLPSWFGGGYSVANNSKHKQEAIDFLKWMFRPDGWAKSVWESGVTFPAQKYDQFMTGKETPVQKDLSAIFNNAKSYSGTIAQDIFTPNTQKTFFDTIQKLEASKITPQEFVKAIDDAADQSAKASK